MLSDSVLAEIHRKRRLMPYWPWVFFFGPFVAIVFGFIHPMIAAIMLLLWLPGVIVQYDLIEMKLPDGTEAEIYVSNPGSVEPFVGAFAIVKQRDALKLG